MISSELFKATRNEFPFFLENPIQLYKIAQTLNETISTLKIQ